MDAPSKHSSSLILVVTIWSEQGKPSTSPGISKYKVSLAVNVQKEPVSTSSSANRVYCLQFGDRCESQIIKGTGSLCADALEKGMLQAGYLDRCQSATITGNYDNHWSGRLTSNRLNMEV